MSSFVAVRAMRTAINNGNAPWRSLSSSKTQPKSTTTTTPSIPEPPSNVFKKVDSKELGPGASKQSGYKNPEYFKYHNMSYAEMEVVMTKMRVPQPTNKKR